MGNQKRTAPSESSKDAQQYLNGKKECDLTRAVYLNKSGIDSDMLVAVQTKIGYLKR